MIPAFEIAGGSIVGHAHVAAGRNNQDAFCWAQNDAGLVAVVCDGCGSAAHSDVGAQLGARLIVEAALRRLAEPGEPAELLERARVEVVEKLRALAMAMSVEAGSAASSASKGAAKRYSSTVLEHFLFTVVGVLVAHGSATPFGLGDGLVVVDGERHVLGPYPNNEPPYLGYDLLDTGKAPRPFETLPAKNAADLQSLLIGTDGVLELEGQDQPGEGLEQFWKDDRFFRNPDMVRRRLVMMTRGRANAADDTTLVVVRRQGSAKPNDPPAGPS